VTEHADDPTRNAKGDVKESVRFVVEVVTPTGQQQEKIADGLRLVLELLLRRYRRGHTRADSREIPPETT